MSSKLVCDNIKQARTRRNVSRAQVAKFLNITVSGYSRKERGEVVISVNTLIQISKFLGAPIAELFEGVDERPLEDLI